MNIIPTILEKNNNREYAFDLYSKLLNDRIIFITGEITDISANLVTSQLLYLDSLNKDDIYIYINSPGGSVTAGLAIYDTINYIKSDVSTIGMGLCASMAAVILSSGTIGKRNLLKNADVMIHQPIGGTNGQASDIKIVADRILDLKYRLNLILSKNTGQLINKIELDTDRDNYLDSKKAKSYGLVDNIL